ncbi:MAG: hypothetical protein WC725_04830 [Patescibacteria group bacterium]|jgi:hypothetical protein
MKTTNATISFVGAPITINGKKRAHISLTNENGEVTRAYAWDKTAFALQKVAKGTQAEVTTAQNAFLPKEHALAGFSMAYSRHMAGEITQKAAAALCGVSAATYKRRVIDAIKVDNILSFKVAA